MVPPEALFAILVAIIHVLDLTVDLVIAIVIQAVPARL